jgi:guanosine-3',5'-bis(diphosphate) 3'-pyrophosphohydrolase
MIAYKGLLGQARCDRCLIQEIVSLTHPDLMTPRLDRALRMASAGHDGQVRRGSGVPYVEHVTAVAWILDRAGFDEDVIIAGLLHDLVEDTVATLEDERGLKRPWLDRKRDHLAAIATAPVEARAVILADKLHNLISIAIDLREGHPVWGEFHADRDQVLWYYHAVLDRCRSDDPRLQTLELRCREVLDEILAIGSGMNSKGSARTGGQDSASTL